MEIKSGSAGLAKRDIEQVEDTLKLMDAGECMVKGHDEPIEAFRLVFTDPNGARKSMETLEKWFDDFTDVDFSVEVFIDGQRTVATSFDDLEGVLL